MGNAKKQGWMMGKHLDGRKQIRLQQIALHGSSGLVQAMAKAMTQRKYLRVPHYPPHPAQSSPQTQTARNYYGRRHCHMKFTTLPPPTGVCVS